jgi:hypothetical protein
VRVLLVRVRERGRVSMYHAKQRGAARVCDVRGQRPPPGRPLPLPLTGLQKGGGGGGGDHEPRTETRPDRKLTFHSLDTNQSLNYLRQPPLGARVPKSEFLRLFAPESTTITPRTHYNARLALHRPVVLPVSSLAAFGKSPGPRGSRIGPGTPPKRGYAAGTALRRNWEALSGEGGT